MSNWQIKSNSSFEAANNLIDHKLFNPSIHSCYYGCVQYVYYIFEDYFGHDIKDIEGGSRLVARNLSNHIWLRQEIFKSLKTKDKKAAVNFQNIMGQLCNKRVLADYHYEICKIEDANNSKKTAQVIMDVLRTFYI